MILNIGATVSLNFKDSFGTEVKTHTRITKHNIISSDSNTKQSKSYLQ